jgi:hypothetical protein
MRADRAPPRRRRVRLRLGAAAQPPPCPAEQAEFALGLPPRKGKDAASAPHLTAKLGKRARRLPALPCMPHQLRCQATRARASRRTARRRDACRIGRASKGSETQEREAGPGTLGGGGVATGVVGGTVGGGGKQQQTTSRTRLPETKLSLSRGISPVLCLPPLQCLPLGQPKRPMGKEAGILLATSSAPAAAPQQISRRSRFFASHIERSGNPVRAFF